MTRACCFKRKVARRTAMITRCRVDAKVVWIGENAGNSSRGWTAVLALEPASKQRTLSFERSKREKGQMMMFTSLSDPLVISARIYSRIDE
eukprot:5334324-Pleurochrysis_carterae.AAC.2